MTAAPAVSWIEAPGGVRLRAACWPEGARGAIMLLNGRSEFVEKYADVAAAFQQRGFAVWTMDLRGQGLSTRALPDRLRHHVDSFDEYLDDAALLLDRHVLPALAGRKLVLAGHSMGGHVALRLLAARPGLFAGAVLLAPMVGVLPGGAVLDRLVRALVAAICRVPGAAARYAPGTPRAPLVGRPFEGNRMTSSPDDHAALDRLLRDQPEMQLGGATWAWLRAALSSLAVLRRPGFAEAIALPVLMLLAEDERIVRNDAARRFAARLPDCALLEFAGARHELLRERPPVRAAVWAALDRFLDRL